MMKYFLIAMLLFTTLIALSQVANANSLNLSQAKTALENLNTEFIKLDNSYSDYISPCKIAEKNYQECSERETKRREQEYQKLENQREFINQQISNILALTFTEPLKVTFGKYNPKTQKLSVLYQDVSQGSLKISSPDAAKLTKNSENAEVMAVVAIHLNSENSAQEYLLDGKLDFAGRSYKIDSGVTSEARAMLMVYGNYEPKSRNSSWRGQAKTYTQEPREAQDYEAEIVYSKRFREGGLDKFVLVTSSFYDDCHACGAIIGVAKFVRKADGIWQFEAGQRIFGEYGTHGAPPEFNLAQIGGDKFGLSMRTGYTGQGITTEHLTLLSSFGTIYKTILAFKQISQDTSGAELSSETELSFDSQFSFSPKPNSEYFDLLIKSTGEKGVKVGNRYVVRPFTSFRKYSFASDSYKIVRGKELH